MSNKKTSVTELLIGIGCLTAIIGAVAFAAGFLTPWYSYWKRHKVDRQTEELLLKGIAAHATNDYDAAVKYYTAAAELGNAGAQFELGICFSNGDGVKQDKSEAVKWYRKAAKQGHAEAQFELGICFSYGDGVKQDKSEAVKWYRKAAEQGHAEARFMLGCCYKAGIGVEKDEAESEKWFQKAADQGDQSAGKQLDLRKLMKAIGDNDENTMREIQEFWLKDATRKATEENDRMSQLGLAVYHENNGNTSEAVKWYRKAAENGDHLAQYRLGNFYDKGEGGVQQDKAEAVKWFRMGAEQNVIDCQYVLGLHYENGEGVDKDMDEAVKWYRKAADNGQRDAIDALNRLGVE